MFVIVNGQTQPLPERQTLSELLLLLSPPHPFVVARNEELVPRDTYADCRIAPGDRIDIVHPTAGG